MPWTQMKSSGSPPIAEPEYQKAESQLPPRDSKLSKLSIVGGKNQRDQMEKYYKIPILKDKTPGTVLVKQTDGQQAVYNYGSESWEPIETIHIKSLSNSRAYVHDLSITMATGVTTSLHSDAPLEMVEIPEAEVALVLFE